MALTLQESSRGVVKLRGELDPESTAEGSQQLQTEKDVRRKKESRGEISRERWTCRRCQREIREGGGAFEIEVSQLRSMMVV